MGNAEKFKPTQPGANNPFVEPALLSRHHDLTWFFSPRKAEKRRFGRAGRGFSELFTGRRGARGQRVGSGHTELSGGTG